MAYIPNATDSAEPIESQTVESAALEFRTLKISVNARLAAIQSEIEAEESSRAAGDAVLQGNINAEAAIRASADATLSVRTTTLEQLAFNGATPGAAAYKEFIADGISSTFTLDFAPITVATIDVFVNGLAIPFSEISIAGTLVTLNGTLDAGDEVVIKIAVPLTIGITTADAVEYGPAGVGAVATTVQSKLRERVSVKDFGASSDSTPVQNQVAIQKAIDHVNAVGGGTVYIPAGIYLIAPASGLVALTLKSNVALVGDSRQGTIIKLATNGNAHVLNADSVVNIGVRSLTIDGNKANQTQTGTHCLRVVNSNVIDIEDVRCHHAKNYGMGLQYPATYLPNVNIRIVNCEVDYNGETGGDGLDIKHGVNVYLENIYAHHNAEQGVDCRGVNASYIGIVSEYNGGNGITLRGNLSVDTTPPTPDIPERGWTISAVNCHANFNGEAGILVTNNSGLYAVHASLVGCTASHNAVGFSVEDTHLHSVLTTCSAKYSTSHGFFVQTSSTDSKTTFIGCTSRNNGGSGFYNNVQAYTTTEFTNCEAIDNADRGCIAATAYPITVVGGLFSGNATDGVRLQPGSKIIGATVKGNTRYGIDNVLYTDTLVSGNTVSGNGTSQIRTIPPYSANAVVSDNIGTPTTFVGLSESLALGSTGLKTAVIPHSLGFTPSKQHISVDIYRDQTVIDFVLGFVTVSTVSGTNITVIANVVTASATGAATFKIGVKVDASRGV